MSLTAADSASAGAGQRFIEQVGDWLCAPAELCVLLMMLHMLLDVAVRAVSGAGMEGMVESVTHLYMVGAAFLPVAALEARSQHLRVQALAERLPPRGAMSLDLFARLVTLLVCVAMAWLTTLQALDATRLGDHVELTTWSLPIWPARWVFPLAFALMAVAALVHGIQLVRGLSTSRASRP